MEINVTEVARRINPAETSLFLGAGSSVSSGAPLGYDLQKGLIEKFRIEDAEQLEFESVCTLVEQMFSRTDLVQFVEYELHGLKPRGGMVDLPRFDWRTIYTTNFDTLVEQSFRRASVHLAVASSSKQFGLLASSMDTRLLKMHGTIGTDLVYGNGEPMVLTKSDFRNAESYRTSLFQNLKNSFADTDLLIVGYSISDPHFARILRELTAVKAEANIKRRPIVCVHKTNSTRNLLLSDDGYDICECSFDDLISALLKEQPEQRQIELTLNDALDVVPDLRAEVQLVDKDIPIKAASVSRMFNGRPATYSDIINGMTFEREAASAIVNRLSSGACRVTVLTGVSGVGKTTTIRQGATKLGETFQQIWELKEHATLDFDRWKLVHKRLREMKFRGLLIIDDVHRKMSSFARLIDHLANSAEEFGLYLLCSAHIGAWKRRQMPYSFYKSGVGWSLHLSRLSNIEIERLVMLYRTQPRIQELADDSFSGFTQQQIIERLRLKCKSDMFVCLKNIFSSDEIDDIILNEYSEIPTGAKYVYRVVSALQNSGVNVHRIMAVRHAGVPINQVPALLNDLTDIIEERPVDERSGLYVWQVRHDVIAGIIRKYKYQDEESLIQLFEDVINTAVPFNQIERETLIGLCDASGVESISDVSERLRLYRKMISVGPDIKIPRHRLIKTLINDQKFDDANIEIASFKKNIGYFDATVTRLRADILYRRATKADSKLNEDRVRILSQARSIVEDGLDKNRGNQQLLNLYFKIGVQLYKWTKIWDVYEAAVRQADQIFSETENREYLKMKKRYETLVLAPM